MGKLSLTLACGPYDRTEALRTGAIQPEGIDLKYITIQSPPEIFVRIIRNEDELNAFREYIRQNPARWESDEENPFKIANEG